MVLAVGFSADGKTIATASSNLGVQFWDVATGDKFGGLGAVASASDVAFSLTAPVDSFATVRSQRRRGDLGYGRRRSRSPREVDARDDLDYVPSRFSPDGHMLAAGGFGRIVRLWDVRTRKLVRELDQGGDGAFTLEFGPDGRTLAISGYEPAASLWDVASGTQIGPQLTAGDRRTMIDLSSDGRQMLEVHGNGQGAVWDVDPESWKRRACDLANRTLTREEWEEYLPGRPYEPACAPCDSGRIDQVKRVSVGRRSEAAGA